MRLHQIPAILRFRKWSGHKVVDQKDGRARDGSIQKAFGVSWEFGVCFAVPVRLLRVSPKDKRQHATLLKPINCTQTRVGVDARIGRRRNLHETRKIQSPKKMPFDRLRRLQSDQLRVVPCTSWSDLLCVYMNIAADNQHPNAKMWAHIYNHTRGAHGTRALHEYDDSRNV